jgi:hypothetical protein
VKGALITGSIVSLAVTAAWAWMSSLTIGPVGPLHLTWWHPAASYVTLAAARPVAAGGCSPSSRSSTRPASGWPTGGAPAALIP